MRYRFSTLAAGFLGAAMGLSGCAERGAQVLAPGEGSALSIEASVDVVAHVFALGMASPDVRAAVRDAMRASPLTEHKLSLREFVTTAAGARLLRAAAGAGGIGLSDLRIMIAALPDLDFYVPARQHRLTWRGTGNHVVAVSLDGHAPTRGYRGDGTAVAIDPTQAVPPENAVLLLQAAESKSPRVLPQPNRAGSVIQDPEDGELSGVLLITDKEGTTRTIFLADLMGPGGASVPLAECYEDCGGGGGGGGAPPPQTFLERIITYGVCDNGFCWEGNEFEFRAMTPSGTTNAIRIEGIESTESRYLHIVLINALPPMWVGGEGGAIAARETDAWPNPDDFFYFYYTFQYGYPPPGYSCASIPLGSNVENQEDKLRYFDLREDGCYNPFTMKVQFNW